MVLKKKAISPVVATALLLVVAVVAVVGFQSWFQTYNSGLTADVEQRSANTEGIGVEMVEYLNASDNVSVYLKNAGTSDILNVNVKVGSCSKVFNITQGVVAYSIDNGTNCGIADGETQEVTAIADGGVYREKEIVR